MPNAQLHCVALCLLLLAPYADASVRNSEEATFKESLLAVKNNPPAVTDGFSLNSEAVKVDPSLTFPQQVVSQQKNVAFLQKLSTIADTNFKNAKTAATVRAATVLRDSMLPYTFTFNVAAERAQSLKKDGYLLKNINSPQNIKAAGTAGNPTITASACNGGGQCADVDPVVALFMIAFDALVKEFKKDKPFGPNNEITKAIVAVGKFVERPAGGDSSAFVIARSVIIPRKDNGEIARILRDPVHRPIEVIEDGLKFLNNDNGIVAQAITRPGDVIFKGWDPRPQDNGDIARAIRDPVNCTVGKLWGSCK